MAAFNDDFHFVAASVERAVYRQRQACQRLLVNHPCRDGALVRHIEFAYEAIDIQLADRRTSYGEARDDTDRRDAVIDMRRLVWTIHNLQTSLDWLAAAHDPPLDLGSTYFVEDAARRIVTPNVELTVISVTRGSYSTTSDPLQPLIDAWGGGIPKDESTVAIVFIPRREENACLLHPLIVHELGHAADAQHALVDSVWKQAQKRKRLSTKYSRAVKQYAEEEKVEDETASENITAMLRSWIAEALCDCIGTHYLGPTFLYSFLVEVGAATMDEASVTHPPARQRIRRQLADLDRLGWGETMGAGAPQLDGWARGLADSQPAYGGVQEFLVWAVEDLQAVVRKTVSDLLKDSVFRPNLADFAEINDLLSANIPPAQSLGGEPVHRAAIILACWYAAIMAAGGRPADLPDAAERSELGEILPAALELSALARAWEPDA